jgi:type II secretory pathway pseudopilin PulG
MRKALKKALFKLGKDIISRGEKGVTLVESLVAIGILGGGVMTLILAMSGGALAIQENDQQAVAQSLARTQIEYIKNYPFDKNATTYPSVSTPEGYGISVEVTEPTDCDNNIQKITATITRGGAVILTAEDYKVDR